MTDHETDRTGNRQNFDIEHATQGWGTQENLGVAGDSGKLGDFCAKWWIRWAVLGVLIAGLVVVLVVTT